MRPHFARNTLIVYLAGELAEMFVVRDWKAFAGCILVIAINDVEQFAALGPDECVNEVAVDHLEYAVVVKNRVSLPIGVFDGQTLGGTSANSWGGRRTPADSACTTG